MRNIIKKIAGWLFGPRDNTTPEQSQEDYEALQSINVKPKKGTMIWKVTDAIIVTMLRNPVPVGGWTAEALATALSSCEDFAFESSLGLRNGSSHLTPSQVNAAISGISTRAAGGRPRHWVTDVLEPWIDPKEGLKKKWDKRVWHLTPEGRAEARRILRSKGWTVTRIDEMRERREVARG